MAPTILPTNIQTLVISEGINLVAAILILVAGWMLSNWLSRWTRAGLDRVAYVDPSIKPMLTSFVRYAILLATLTAVLERFGVETTSLLAVFGAAGLAVGLALQGTLANVASGVMLLVLRPFHVGEYIQLKSDGAKARVFEIGLFRTRVVTRDNIHMSIPNATIFAANISNYSREVSHRLDILVPIDRVNDLDLAERLVLEAMKGEARVLDAPEPFVGVEAIEPYALVLVAKCWVKSADQFRTPYALRKRITQALDKGGILMPVPRQAVAVRNELQIGKTAASGDFE